MKTVLGLLSLVALSVPAVVPQASPGATLPASLPSTQIRLEGDEVVLSFGREGLLMIELLDALAEVSGRTVFYTPTEVGDRRLFGAGELAVSRGELLDTCERLFRDADYLLSDEGPPVSALRLFRVGAGGDRDLRGRLQRELIDLADLDQRPRLRGAIYSTVLPLEFVDARSAMASFQPYFDTSTDGIRNMENSNALLLSSLSMDTLRHVVAMARLADQPRQGESVSLQQRVIELEGRVAALARSVAELQAASGDH